eukprot:1157718-Pelagomonas_calceolata.AAC.4
MQPQHLPWRNNHHTFWTMVGRTAQIKLGTQTSTLEVCKAVYTNSHNNLRHGGGIQLETEGHVGHLRQRRGLKTYEEGCHPNKGCLQTHDHMDPLSSQFIITKILGHLSHRNSEYAHHTVIGYFKFQTPWTMITRGAGVCMRHPMMHTCQWCSGMVVAKHVLGSTHIEKLCFFQGMVYE